MATCLQGQIAKGRAECMKLTRVGLGRCEWQRENTTARLARAAKTGLTEPVNSAEGGPRGSGRRRLGVRA